MPVKSSDTFLYFARKDRRGALVLLSVVLLICSIPFLYPLFIDHSITETSKFDSSLATLKTKQESVKKNKYAQKREDDYRPYDHPSSSYTSYKPTSKGTLFYFDPNTIGQEEWKKLGLRDKTIATILNFRNKGGKFREPEDIKKIWGLFPDEADRLIPYVQIAENKYEEEPGSNNFTAVQSKKYDAGAFTTKILELNGADTAAFIALPGIGSKLSQRIINFRDKLGGFYKVEQVAETFGLPDSVFRKIQPMLQVSGEVKKINLNMATLDELKLHPYIRYHLANAIVQYRTQHGNYKSVEDIKKIMLVTEEIYNKAVPYLSVE
ncbi:MAG: helix-hairpin-helix domain-containing protein [Gloeobacteraceae cyanobacterium ES-bin-316]|nr:helix-hairpin-helix domain-containing protein [Ferruginibacter sp.]